MTSFSRVAIGQALAASAMLCGPSLASADAPPGWTRAFVVDWYEPAFYYGAKDGADLPGTDCPAGTNPELDWRKLLKTSYRTDADIEVILDPEKPLRAQMGGIRGPNKEDVYKQPWVVPDPGLTGVTGKVAYGFNLDGNAKTGFQGMGLKGEKAEVGVDNQYYRAAGCWMSWRGPTKSSHHAKYVNDGMRDGVFTVAMVVSGQGKDPNNDPNVSVAFYLSKDKLVKDANGLVARDYSFRINPDPRFQSVIRARTVKGVLESTESAELRLRHMETAPFFPAQLLLHDGRVRMAINDDGTGIALLGGYRPIDDYYKGWAASGAIHELVTHINMVGYWYALRKNADYPRDAPQDKRTAISTAYRLYLTPAFVIAPNGDDQVRTAQLFDGPIDKSIGAMRMPSRPAAAPAPAPAP
jgi:hypothetical protein